MFASCNSIPFTPAQLLECLLFLVLDHLGDDDYYSFTPTRCVIMTVWVIDDDKIASVATEGMITAPSTTPGVQKSVKQS
jgi:hypothetical protein